MSPLKAQQNFGPAPKRASDQPSHFKFRIVTIVPSERQGALDHALEETFPASDPVSITITVVVRVTSGRLAVN